MLNEFCVHLWQLKACLSDTSLHWEIQHTFKSLWTMSLSCINFTASNTSSIIRLKYINTLHKLLKIASPRIPTLWQAEPKWSPIFVLDDPYYKGNVSLSGATQILHPLRQVLSTLLKIIWPACGTDFRYLEMVTPQKLRQGFQK